jgi:hypothetical protein
MNELMEQLGKSMTAKGLAEYLNLDEKTIRQYAWDAAYCSLKRRS